MKNKSLLANTILLICFLGIIHAEKAAGGGMGGGMAPDNYFHYVHIRGLLGDLQLACSNCHSGGGGGGMGINPDACIVCHSPGWSL